MTSPDLVSVTPVSGFGDVLVVGDVLVGVAFLWAFLRRPLISKAVSLGVRLDSAS